MNPPTAMKLGAVNAREWRGAEIPAANGHTTARALARLYGALARGGEVDGVRIISPMRFDAAILRSPMATTRCCWCRPVSAAALCSLSHTTPGAPAAYVRPSGRGRFTWLCRSRRENWLRLHDEQDGTIYPADPRARGTMIEAVYAYALEN